METVKVSVDKELDIAIYTFNGNITYDSVRDAITSYYSGRLTKYTVWDFSTTKFNMMSISEVQKLGQQVNSSGKIRKGGVDAIIVTDPLKYGLARVYAAYMEMTTKDKDALKTVIFRSKDDAIWWIRSNEAKKTQAL